MGFEQAPALSIPQWLSTQSRYEQAYPLANPPTYKQDAQSSHRSDFWDSTLPNSREETDQGSIVSLDDNISIGDSTHGSYSSEGSSRISWTSATESSDAFIDEDAKDHIHPLSRVASYDVDEFQHHTLGGTCKDDQSIPDSAFIPQAFDNTSQSSKCGLSRLLRSSCLDRAQQAVQSSSRSWRGNTGSGTTAPRSLSRRSACSSLRSCLPKLKRDTDVTEHFVALLIIFAKRLITAIWPSSDCPPMNTDCFGAGVLPLETFIRETLRRSKTSFSTLQVALYYIVLLRSRMPQAQGLTKCKGETSERAQCRAMQCGRRMFLSALMLASKYLQDRNYSARAWSKISGLRSNEINENEREYLSQINYDLHLTKETFENWSRIVMVLSKLSVEPPCASSKSVDERFGRPGTGSNSSLASMVSEPAVVDCPAYELRSFTGEWWSMLLQKLEPQVAQEASLVDLFLRDHVPANKLHMISLSPLSSQELSPVTDYSVGNTSPVAQCDDLNFGDMSVRKSQPSGIHGLQTPQTPFQMSPASHVALPSRPRLGNLPTPQTTPRLPQQSTGEKDCLRPHLRSAASMDVMRAMRKECFKNANLERCPPPQPQNITLPPLKHFIRSAETMRELCHKNAAGLMSSPLSVSSDSTTMSSSTMRSRASSVSSVSSWSSHAPTMANIRQTATCGLSSPLSRVCSISNILLNSTLSGNRPDQGVQPQVDTVSTSGVVGVAPSSRDIVVEPAIESYGSNTTPTRSEVVAIRGLMSLSSQSESSSQCVTPTQQKQSEHNTCSSSKPVASLYDHKRKLSKTDSNLQEQVRNLIWNGPWPVDNTAVTDTLLPYYPAMHKQMQPTTSLRQENRTPVCNLLDSKRRCSLQRSASTPTALQMSDPLENNILMCR